MISLTRLNGERFAVNPDMIQRADATPDTIITLIDGTKLLIAESIDRLSGIVLAHRASVAAMAIEIAEQTGDDSLATVTGLHDRPHLHATPEVD
ncbi:flagellar FlbD family protein [Demequina aestuarii]|uniref:flagellar FlbD family protein n=1 Tax=Demequina aestuarii TaxID=327095 RepID=UPI000A0147A3|nr:flagellar FlbD family protein [Demequina aestuarii]